MDYIEHAISEAGGVRAVAKAFHISHEAVYKWVRRGYVPSNRVLGLARLAHWQVTPHQLSPEYYPRPSDGMPSTDLNRAA